MNEIKNIITKFNSHIYHKNTEYDLKLDWKLFHNSNNIWN